MPSKSGSIAFTHDVKSIPAIILTTGATFCLADIMLLADAILAMLARKRDREVAWIVFMFVVINVVVRIIWIV